MIVIKTSGVSPHALKLLAKIIILCFCTQINTDISVSLPVGYADVSQNFWTSVRCLLVETPCNRIANNGHIQHQIPLLINLKIDFLADINRFNNLKGA